MTQVPSAGPIPPRLPASLRSSSHAELASADEWDGEAVVGGDLSGCVADHVEIAACELRGVQLTGAELEQLRLVDVVARDCELSGTIAHRSSIVRTEFHNCRMTGLVLSEAKLANVRFVDCKLDHANFRFVVGEQVVFDRCSLIDAELYGATLVSTEFDSCDLTRTQFSKATVEGVRLNGSTVEGVRGAIEMSGVVIGGEQVIPLALSIFADLGIAIEYDDEDRDDDAISRAEWLR